jgi:hypothetical protein
MRVEYLVQSPHLRRYAELAVEFVSRVLRDSVLNALEYIVVIERRGTYEEIGSLVKRFCEMIGIEPVNCNEMWSVIVEWLTSDDSRLYSFGVHTSLGGGRGAILWILRDTDVPSVDSESFALFHEVSHHMVLHRGRDIAEQVLDALATNSGFAAVFEELDEMRKQPVPKRLKRLANIEREKLNELIESSLSTFIYEGLQVAAQYMAVNYFMLLNTRPYPYPARFKQLSEFYTVSMWPIFICYVLASHIWHNVIHMRVYRATDRLMTAVETAMKAFKGDVSEEKAVAMPNFTTLLHSIFMESVRVTPKELYLSEPERYSPILYGVIWDDIRKMGFPALDTLVARLDIERAPLYKPYAKLIEVL